MDNVRGNKVLLGPSTFAALDRKPLDLLIENGCVVIDNPFKRKLEKDELITLLDRDVAGLIAGLEPLDREVLEKSKLKVISRCGSGMSNVDLTAAAALGIKVFSTPFGPTNSVAELTLACLLALLRELPQMDMSMHSKKWDKRIGFELCGKKVAIIGYGRIGQRVGELLAAFGATVIAVDPAYDDSHQNILKMELHEALKAADAITIHSSGEALLLGDKEFAIMKQGVYLLNAARGALIDENTLVKNLENGKIAGAWLDTYENEPYSGPLCNFKQLILTPHIGSYTIECRRQMEMEASENLLKGLQLA
jgi:D-3-phosphoglycerate dehydrogenase